METSQPHKFTFKLSQRLDLRICKVHLPLQNLSIYFTWTNIRPHYRKKQAQYGFYSLSDIQDYIKYVIKKHETLHNNFLVHIYRLTGFLIDQCLKQKFELQTSETMKSFDSTKKLKHKTMNGENVPSLEVV